ncbi:MAG TPA: WD40 repeat domain-containing protein [Syntrophorhabdaceae bacterium]|nr:WD40 repeat domain-containing protein [Syntrophorhabdaceae bacterium]
MKHPGTSDKTANMRLTPVKRSAAAASRDIIRDILADFCDTGRITHRVGMHLHQYHGVHITADGSRMITANRDHTARLWDIASGQCLVVFRGHTDELRRAAFTIDGKRAVTCANDGTIRLWDCTTGECLLTLNSHEGDVYTVAVSPDNNYIVSGGSDGTLRIWSLLSGACEHVAIPAVGSIVKVLFTGDAGTLVTLDSSGRVCRWGFPDPGSPFLITEGRFEYKVRDIALMGDGKLISASWAGLHCFDVRSGKMEKAFSLEPCKPYKVAVPTDGTRIVACCYPKTAILVVDCQSGTIERRFDGHRDDVTGMALSSDGKTLCTASLDWTCRIWDTGTGTCLRTIRRAWNLVRLFPSGDGTRLAAFDVDGTAKTWSLTDGSQRILSRDVWSVASLDPVNLIATGHKDGRICLWDGKGEPAAVLEAHEKHVSCLASLRSGTYLASASYDGTVKLWDIDRRVCTRSFSISGRITTLAVDEKSQRIATGRILENHIEMYDLGSGDRLAALKGHTWPTMRSLGAAIRCLYFLPDGKGLVSCAHDGRVILWDPVTFEAVQVIEEPRYAILSMAVQKDGRHVVIGTLEQGVHRWDLESGRRESLYHGEGLAALSVALSPDEKTLFAAFGDGTARIIDVKSAALLCTIWNINDGFFWFTPPDEHAPDGWVWTDRNDLLHVVEQDNGGGVLGAVPLDDERRRAYVHTRNNAAMVLARIKGPTTYARTAGRYLRAFAKKQQEAMERPRLLPPKGDGNA